MKCRLSLLLLPLFFMFSGVVKAQEVLIKHDNKHLLANLEMADGKTIEDGIVLMTHGTIAHGQMEIMASLQSTLKESGINSLSITLSLNEDKRQGMYECTNTHSHKHSNAVKEIGLWLDWLKQKGASNITLLGHSRGGNQTAWFAAQSNDPAIKNVVLIAPAYQSYDMKKADYKKSYQKDLDAELKKANELVKSGKGDTVMETDFLYCKDAKVTAASFADYYNDNPNHYTPDLIKKIKAPVLIIAGSADTTVQNVAEVYQSALKPGDKIVTIEGADHFFRDLYAYDIVDAMSTFMGL